MNDDQSRASLAAWRACWKRLDASVDFDEEYHRVAQQYQQPERAYHNLAHIADCLCQLDQVRQQADRPDAIEMAIWYHDVVYDSRKGDNEVKSADQAVDALARFQVATGVQQSVSQLILATRHGASDQDASRDASLMIDIDLSILGQPEDQFDEYDRAIRDEYAWVEWTKYQTGRAAVLQSFLDRGSIYCTDLFRNRYESQARSNLDRAIARLQSATDSR